MSIMSQPWASWRIICSVASALLMTQRPTWLTMLGLCVLVFSGLATTRQTQHGS